MSSEKIKQIPVHYITGIGRSGTTLLSSMLNSSGKILSLPEVYLTLYFYYSKSNKKVFTVEDIQDNLKFFRKLEYLRKMQFYPERLKNVIAGIHSYSDFLRHSFLSVEYIEKSNAQVKYVIDKNPVYTFFVKELLSVFPEAKFILMLRDPRAYINSCVEKIEKGEKNRPPAFFVYSWKKYVFEIRKIMRSYPLKCMLIHYEDLITHPEETLKKICSHLEIPFDAEMLHHHKKEYNLNIKKQIPEKNLRDRAQNKFEPLSKPVNTERMEAWKKNLSEKDLSLIGYELRGLSEQMGYPDITRSPAPEGTFLLRMKYRFLIWLYFPFAKMFYKLPITLREKIRKKV